MVSEMEKIWRLYSGIGDNKSDSIMTAIMRNDCIYIINYFESGKEMDYVDSRNENYLHKACRNNYYEVADLFLKLGIDINAKNKYGDTPLHIAVQYKCTEVVEKLIVEGADVNALNNNMVAPIHLAASIGDETILNMLLEHSAKINVADDIGAHPIHYAIKSGKKSILMTLLDNGASFSECDNRKNNVLHYACQSGSDELVEYILRHILITDARNIYGQTPLHLAAMNCTVKTLSALLNSGFNLNLKDENGKTPYDYAIENEKPENADYLESYENSSEYRTKYSRYKIHRAVCNNNIHYLFEKINSSNVNEYDYFGKSAMYYAIVLGYPKIVELLYKKGANIDKVDENNHSALLIATYSENVEIIKYLLIHGADPNEIYYNRSYLYRAIIRNNLELVTLLVEYGANVNYVDNHHRTVYSYAMEYADDSIIEILLDKRATLV